MARIIESVERIEPCHLETVPVGIASTIAELARRAEQLQSGLHRKTAASLAELVRVMNCYYSNLIEGHDTRPRDIERALNNQLDLDKGRRNLQLEAIAHIRVQREIDRLYASNRMIEPGSIPFVKWLHREFYHGATQEMLTVENGNQRFIMTPGEFRSSPDHDVEVGRHMPPSSHRVFDFMRHFEARYDFGRLGTAERIISIATAHHRLNYIHPFPDGNGRVSRLMSHAMALLAGIGAHGLWSISRGLARGLASPREYKQMMDRADSPRAGDYDGRGNLSHGALVEFVDWFLKVALDQATFMADMFDLPNLTTRLRRYIIEQLRMRPEAANIVEEVLIRGEMERGAAARVTGLSERSGRDVLAKLVNAGLLASDTPKGAVSLRFPTHTVEALFPRLYPET